MPAACWKIGVPIIEELSPLEVTLSLDGQQGTVVPVRLETRVTELGTLEVWCVSRDGAERWKLELNIREKHREVRLVGAFSLSDRHRSGHDKLCRGVHRLRQESADARSAIRVFAVPQLVAHGEVLTLPALPSFLYFPTEDELSSGAVSATWDEDPPMVTGVLAREQGALVPSRQVSSAKSWLSYPGVDRRAKILPAQAEPPQPMISPVEASARYLMHLARRLERRHRDGRETRFEHQEIVLTVPASFDEEARELTVEAARRAGLDQLTLLEEPLAAFYAWIAANRMRRQGSRLRHPIWRGRGTAELRDGELILICDIGGGTTDFSLVRARMVNGELQFERTAIGEHILLGGDNLDFAWPAVWKKSSKETQRLHAATALCVTPGLLCRERAAAE
jgi:hypothetical protein